MVRTIDSLHQTILEAETLRLDILMRLSQPPPLFERGEPLFWDDPHISQHMLATHLDPNTEAASRPPQIIDRAVTWIMDTLKLKAGDSLLDLGCGPGLYCVRLSQRGLRVTGIDYSRRSIDYATKNAEAQHLPIKYIYQNYLTIDYEAQFDAAMLIFGDLCVLSPAERDLLLGKIHRALKPGGQFVFDVTTRKHHVSRQPKNKWYAAETGFWKPGPHLVLEQHFDYPEHDTYVEQYTVIEPTGRISVYRNWFLDYDPASITAAVEKHGFKVCGTWNDLCGTPYTPETEWIGVLARKV